MGRQGNRPVEMHRYSLREQCRWPSTDETNHRQSQHRFLPRHLGRWSCFNKVIPALQADGHEVISVQYGLASYDHDVAAVKRTQWDAYPVRFCW